MGRLEFCKGCVAKNRPESDDMDAQLSVSDQGHLYGGYDIFDQDDYFVRGSYGDFTKKVPDGLKQAAAGCRQIEEISKKVPGLISEEEMARRANACQAIRSIFPAITPEALSQVF